MITLERHLVLSGKGNRRKCAYLIRRGEVTVGDKIVTDSKFLVSHTDCVKCDGETLTAAPLQTVLLWKPPGYVCQHGEKDPSAYELLPPIPGLSLVGRLDRDSEGLIIATNDGDLSHHLTSPEHHVPKTYHVKINGRITDKLLQHLCSGLPLDNQSTRPLEGKILRKEGSNTWIQLILTEGKKRQIRRLCEQIDKNVIRLLRVSIGELTTAHLKPKQYRKLKEKELNKL